MEIGMLPGNFGISPTPQKALVTPGQITAVGDLMMLNLASPFPSAPQNALSRLGIAITPAIVDTVDGYKFFPMVIAAEAAAAAGSITTHDGDIEVWTSGVINAKVLTTALTKRGTRLHAASGVTTLTAATGGKFCAILMEQVLLADAGTNVRPVLFFGMEMGASV